MNQDAALKMIQIQELAAKTPEIACMEQPSRIDYPTSWG